MTCREKLAKEFPHCVSDMYTGGCSKCPHDYGYLPRPEVCNSPNACKECWDREIPEEKEEDVTIGSVDVHKIIDDAMEKKNRSVFIHISPNFGTTVKVEPYDPTPKKWIRKEGGNLMCPECGWDVGYYRSSEPCYCPMCGEKIAQSNILDKEVENNDL